MTEVGEILLRKKEDADKERNKALKEANVLRRQLSELHSIVRLVLPDACLTRADSLTDEPVED